MIKRLNEGQFDKYSDRINKITSKSDLHGNLEEIRKNVEWELDDIIYDIINDFKLPMDKADVLKASFKPAIDDFINNLKTIRTNRASALAKDGLSLNDELQAYYIEAFPTDDLGWDIDSNATFNDLLQALDDEDVDLVYDLCVNDSTVRERLFDKLADILNVSHDKIYNKFIKCSR